MEFFRKKIGPVFLKEDSDAEKYMEKLNTVYEKAEEPLKKDIEKEIKLVSQGIIGEKNISFELKNCDIDMYILHDIYLEYNDLKAQIDYLIITRKRIYVIECKNLIGNIEIDSNGNFIRTYELFGKQIKEGIYSPITQNERHRVVIKELRAQEKNIILKKFFEKNFDNTYKSIIVLANPKTLLNAKFAKKDVKDQVIRADQLVKYIREKDKEVTDLMYSEEEMRKLATFFLEKNISERSDYSQKYENIISEINSVKEKTICPLCGSELVLRTAIKGNNAGKQFYGCKAFPKCRYTQNVN